MAIRDAEEYCLNWYCNKNCSAIKDRKDYKKLSPLSNNSLKNKKIIKRASLKTLTVGALSPIALHF